VNPVLGTLPVLQYCSPDQLQIDESYQRSLETGPSQALIRRIAMHWDWGLCQPLFVARRSDGEFYVVDGQHRLAAAKLRGDLWQLPCVVTSFATAAEEAAAFVALNQERRPLSRLEIFKAALAAGDFEASQIVIAAEDAGLHIASSTNLETGKPGGLSNVAGLQSCYRAHGLIALTNALKLLAGAYDGQVLRYAGTLFPGLAAIVAKETESDGSFADGEFFKLMIEMVAGATQSEWGKEINQAHADELASSRRAASVVVFERAWAECKAELLDEAA
jgi:hypothetical protein